MDKLKDEFFSQTPKGVDKDNFWKDYSARMFARAAEVISKASQEEF